MHRTKPAHTALTVLLALSALLMGAGAGAQGNKPDRDPIDVTVVGGKTTVTEEEARTNDKHGGLVWRAPKGFRFPADGIVFDTPGKGKHRCAVTNNPQRYRCAKLGHQKGARYKYIVNLVEESSGKLLDPLDPYILNE